MRYTLGRVSTVVAVLIVLPCAILMGAQEAELVQDVSSEPVSAIKATKISDQRKVDLGERLFHDPILSGKGMISCASCHSLSQGGTVRLPRTIGYNGRMHRFNAPTIFNVAQNYRLGWRGNFTKLEEQNEAVILDPNLMASEWKTLVSALSAAPRYSEEFSSVYGRSIGKADVIDALVQFQRSLDTPGARFDRYLEGDEAVLTAREIRGYELFKSNGCASCHQGRNVGGNLFERFGVFADANTEEFLGDTIMDDGDLGRYTVTHLNEDKGVFRVPSLRNVDVTAPYFHDGRTFSLDQAITIMAKLQLGHELEVEDVSDIAAFLRTLTGEYKGRKLANE
ncbi:cytochrome-c peroxidase [Rhizobium leguminosarum]|uniref:cytochrome-c peroxidase n=1 Tax=Rhizobium leguminosarum TaxID=384 RepID=UPI003F956539